MNKILEINGVTKEFKGFKLDNITFTLDKGYIMGFIGPNGAGKTTLFNALTRGNAPTTASAGAPMQSSPKSTGTPSA